VGGGTGVSLTGTLWADCPARRQEGGGIVRRGKAGEGAATAVWLRTGAREGRWGSVAALEDQEAVVGVFGLAAGVEDFGQQAVGGVLVGDDG